MLQNLFLDFQKVAFDNMPFGVFIVPLTMGASLDASGVWVNDVRVSSISDVVSFPFLLHPRNPLYCSCSAACWVFRKMNCLMLCGLGLRRSRTNKLVSRLVPDDTHPSSSCFVIMIMQYALSTLDAREGVGRNRCLHQSKKGQVHLSSAVSTQNRYVVSSTSSALWSLTVLCRLTSGRLVPTVATRNFTYENGVPTVMTTFVQVIAMLTVRHQGSLIHILISIVVGYSSIPPRMH